jgi:cobalt-zinc-cadmium efflux system protein
MTQHMHSKTLPAGSKLKLSILLTGLILAAELIGGFISNSLALLSDAGHVVTDIMALSLSWYALKQAERPPSSRMTYGYHRIGVIVAIINAVSIFAISIIILYEAYRRFQQPPEINSVLMMSVASVGLAVNLFVIFWLRREQSANINIRSAFWHAFGDALASIGVIVGGAIILLTGLYWVDPLVSILISLIIGFAAYSILKEGLRVLMEASPSNIDIEEMVKTLRGVPGVKDIHDVHVWAISPQLNAMSSHVLVDDLLVSQAAEIRRELEDVLKNRFSIQHTMLQMECQQCNPSDTFCTLDSQSNNKCDTNGA